MTKLEESEVVLKKVVVRGILRKDIVQINIAAQAEIAVLSLPVMSVRNWSNYVNMISAQFQRPCWGLYTRIIVKPDAKSQFKVHFEMAGVLEKDFLGAVHPRLEMCLNTLNVPYDLTPPAEQKEEAGGKY